MRDSILANKNPNWKGGKVEKTCKFCDKKFSIFPSAIKYGYGQYCSKSCKMTHTRTGVKHSKETIEKIRKSHIGKKRAPFSQEWKDKISKAGIGKKVSEKNRIALVKRNKGNKYGFGFRGENSPNWKGGITPLSQAIRGSIEYRQWRSDCFTRDKFTCQECLVKGGYLEVHHIKEFSVILKEYSIKSVEESRHCEELWNLNNGRTLCKKCHFNITFEK